MIHYYLSDSNGQAFTRLVVGDGLSAVVETGDDGLAELRIGATGSITETDPVFTAWLATPPALSIFTNDNGFITDISGLTAGAVTSLSGHNVSELNNDAGYSTGGGSETDPIFTAWLAAPGNSPSFSALNLTDGAGSGYFTWSSSTGVMLYNSNNNLTALTVGWIYGDGSGLTGVLTDASAFATAAQGALADTALQSLTGHNVSELTNDAGFITDISGLTAGAVTSLSGHNVSELNNDAGYYVGDGSAFATAAQGALADTALQPTGDGGALSLASYIPTTPSNWGGIPPSTLAEALDRIAYNLVLAGFTP